MFDFNELRHKIPTLKLIKVHFLLLPSGAALLAHPGEDATGDIIVVSAPRCTFLRAAEELGLCKIYSDGNMEAFSYDDKDNFKNSGNSARSINLY